MVKQNVKLFFISVGDLVLSRQVDQTCILIVYKMNKMSLFIFWFLCYYSIFIF